MASSVIETGVDKLVSLIGKRKKISLKEASKILGVGVKNIEEWADFLEEEGLISIDRTFTNTFLVEKKLSKTEFKKRFKEYETEQDAFLRSVQGTMSDVESDIEAIRVIRSEFKNIESEVGDDLEQVRDELENIEKFKEFQRRVKEKKSDLEMDYKKDLDEMHKSITNEQKRLQEILDMKQKKDLDVQRQKKDVDDLITREKALLDRMEAIKKQSENLAQELEKRTESVSGEKKALDEMMKRIDNFNSQIEKNRSAIGDMESELRDREESIKGLETEFLERLKKSDLFVKKTVTKGKEIQERFRNFFAKHDQIENSSAELAKNLDELDKKLLNLANKADALSVSVAAGKASKYLSDLETELKELKSRKGVLKRQLTALRALLRTRI